MNIYILPPYDLDISWCLLRSSVYWQDWKRTRLNLLNLLNRESSNLPTLRRLASWVPAASPASRWQCSLVFSKNLAQLHQLEGSSHVRDEKIIAVFKFAVAHVWQAHPKECSRVANDGPAEVNGKRAWELAIRLDIKSFVLEAFGNCARTVWHENFTYDMLTEECTQQHMENFMDGWRPWSQGSRDMPKQMGDFAD